MKEFSEKDKRRISKQFSGFCCRVLKNEANNIRAEYKREADYKINFSELSNNEQTRLYAFDCYFKKENIFNVCGFQIIVADNNLSEAIQRLPHTSRNIILLSYFADMTDTEIAKQLNLSYWAVYRQRIKSLKQLKKFFNLEVI